jgi:hypothetical protein
MALFCRATKHEPLPDDLRNGRSRTLSICQGARVVLEIQFGKVKRQVLLADLMVSAVKGPLRVSEKAFGGVGCGDTP